MPDTLPQKYIKLFNKLNILHKTDDKEIIHIVQDSIYRKFIRDIATNKFSNMKEITKLSKDMNKYVVKNDKNMWYA